MDFKIRQGHPRVLVRPDDVPALRRRAASTHKEQYQSLLDLAAAGPVPGSHGGDYSEPLWRLSFLHLLTQDPAHAQVAIEALRRVLQLDVCGEYFTAARRIKALAAAYDYLHEPLGSELRRQVGLKALAYSQALYDSGEIEPDCYFLGHAINQMPFALMAGIAIGDEIDGGEKSVPLVADMLRRWEKQMPCYRHFLEQDCFQQSFSYTSTYVGEFPWIFNAIEAGLGIEMYRPNAWFANVVKWWTYALREDETFIRFGDYFCAIPVFENGQYFRPLAAIAHRYRDGLAQWWVDRFKLKEQEPETLLFEDRPGVARRLPDQLPRTKHFGPMGVVVARGDFDRGTVASFKCTPTYLHNHGHRDANSFTIYHKGDLAIDSGAYDAYETPHWYNYYIRTIAHNTIVVRDPAEKMVSRGKQYANDGGQRFINEPHFQGRTYEEIGAEVFRDGKVISYREGNGWSYVCGDASNCYRREKVTRFLRHVTFVLDWPRKTCVSLVVLDEIELADGDGEAPAEPNPRSKENAASAGASPSQLAYEPRFLLHTMSEPRIEANRIIAAHAGGRLSATVLLPADAQIEKIGGEGREFEVDGTNYPLNRKMVGPHTPGAWRAEVSGGTGKSRRFLSLLVPADLESPDEPRATLEESAAGWIVRQGDLAVALVKPNQNISVNAARAVRIELTK